MFYERTIASTIQSLSGFFPVVLVTGPRQIGKSTILESLCEPERKVVSLDHPTLRALAKSDPEYFLQRFAPPVLIDEVQYAPELFPYIKILVDSRKQNGDFWLTGSQMFHMMANVSESLAGRVGVLPMLGLTNSEISGRHPEAFEVDIPSLLERVQSSTPMSTGDVFSRIYRGSLPQLYKNEDTPLSSFFESYLDTYVSRDIRTLGQVSNETAFIRFVQVVAARTATNVNYDTLASEVGISAPTAKAWLSLLVSSGLVVLIQPYFHNALKRIIKTPRMYFLDTGLAAHLMGWSSAAVLENSAASGAFFETWVVGEIYKSYLNVGKRPPLYFYRDGAKKEIDLILCKDDTVYPIEIKKSAAPKAATKNFSVLEKCNVGTGAVICLASDLLPIDRQNWYVPAWCI